MLYNSLELALEMETSKFTVETMSFQCFSNILNPCGELIEQVPGDCPTPSENSVGWLYPEHTLRAHVWKVVGFMHMHAVCMYVLCVYTDAYILTHISPFHSKHWSKFSLNIFLRNLSYFCKEKLRFQRGEGEAEGESEDEMEMG